VLILLGEEEQKVGFHSGSVDLRDVEALFTPIILPAYGLRLTMRNMPEYSQYALALAISFLLRYISTSAFFH
jgi:hypothetical protein